MSKSIFMCPYCRRPVSKELFNYRHSLKNIKKAVDKSRKERKADRNEALTPLEAYRTVYDPSYPKQLGWVFWVNELPEDIRPVFANADNLAKTAGVKTPANLPANAGTNVCYVLNDFWYWCLQRVYSTDLRRNAPAIDLDIDIGKQTCKIFCNDAAFNVNGNLLASNADPVCPYADCNKILSCTALEITDEPVEITLIGDPDTGKTVWQVAIASFLQQCNGKQYEIAPGKKLILPETIGWRTNLRVQSFLGGRLPSQTPESSVGGYPRQDKPLVQMTTDDYGDYGAQQAQLVDDRLAEDLVILYREENDRGQVKVSRFVRIFDFAGENSKKGKHGYDDLSILRNCDAMFFFADIHTDKGVASINEFVRKSENVALPYFAMIFPKIDLEKFDTLLFRSISTAFEEALIRVFAYRLRLQPGQFPSQLRTFVKMFLRNYLHCSPESLGMHLFNHFEDKIRALFVDESGEDDINTLFDYITSAEAFRAEFDPKDAKEWVTALCKEHIYLTESAKQRTERPDEQLRRLYINFYLRNLLNGIVDMQAAQKNADDIGLFPVSALGANNELDASALQFNIEEWKPVNLFDPLVWLLKEDSHA